MEDCGELGISCAALGESVEVGATMSSRQELIVAPGDGVVWLDTEVVMTGGGAGAVTL